MFLRLLPRSRPDSGFTLIELLIVVVVIGVLAAIAIPKFGKIRERAIISSMKADIRNYAAAQEVYRAEYPTYANHIDLAAAPYNVRFSNGVGGASQGLTNRWTLMLSTPALPGRWCRMGHNTGAPDDDQIVCN